MRTILVLAALAVFSASSPAVDPPRQPRAGIPADARYFNGKWYYVYAGKLTWEQAKSRCKELGGQLAVIPDEDTWKFLTNNIKSVTENHLWLGGTDEQTEGLWHWVDGTSMKFTAWGGGLPDNVDKVENYLAMWGTRWNDVRNDEPLIEGFVCEWKE
jgi:hypothetical protein